MYMTDTLKTAARCGITDGVAEVTPLASHSKPTHISAYTCRAQAAPQQCQMKKHAFFLCIVFGLHYLCTLEINVYNKICH